MKKTLIAIFSVSVTAGTIYYGYSKFKEYTIKKLVATWAKAQANTLSALNEEKQEKLRSELEKLFAWDLQLLVKLTSKIQNNTSDTEKAVTGKKLIERKIFEKADLSDVTGFLEYKKYTT
jgi:hypothetical protein